MDTQTLPANSKEWGTSVVHQSLPQTRMKSSSFIQEEVEHDI